jgi:predicted amidohydrolase YtcJ
LHGTSQRSSSAWPRAQAQSPGSWIEGVGYNEVQLPEGRHLMRHDLDLASAAHPILVTRTCGHIAVANSLALQLAGIDWATPNPPGGVIVRDADGAPTGILQETAITLVAHLILAPDPDRIEAAIRAAQQHQLSLGITSATDPDVSPEQIRVYRAMDGHGNLRMRMNLLAGRRSGDVRFPLPEVYLSDMLRVDSVKFFADGGMTSATAAISTPYREIGTTGVLIWEDEDLADAMWEAHSASLRIGTHANGDVAIEQVLKIYELLEQRWPGMRHRIEHLALATPEQLARLRAIGTMVATQTVFLPAMGATFRRYMPEHFYPRANGVRSMLDAGLTVALSTDAPVVADINPLLGLKAAIDRRDHAGGPLRQKQTGAVLSGDEQNRGNITRGKWADLAVLSGDPLTTPPDDLLGLVVEQTYVAGALAYERP